VRRLPIVFAVLAFASTFPGCDAEEPAGSGSTVRGTFKQDVAPVIATSCSLTACHASKESAFNFYVTYDPAQIYTTLSATSQTCPSFKFVVPGQPQNSMLMLKMDGDQRKLPDNCASARTLEMPPGDPPDSELLDLLTRDKIRAWIKAGAKND
jgi:hypothetical protein